MLSGLKNIYFKLYIPEVDFFMNQVIKAADW